MTWLARLRRLKERIAARAARRVSIVSAAALLAGVLFAFKCVSWWTRRRGIESSTFLSSLASVPKRRW